MKKLIKIQDINVFIFQSVIIINFSYPQFLVCGRIYQPSININSHISSFKFVEYCKEELEFQQPLNM